MSENIEAVRLVPTDHVALLFSELPQIGQKKMSLAPRQWNSSLLCPFTEAFQGKRAFFVFFAFTKSAYDPGESCPESPYSLCRPDTFHLASL